MEVLMGVDAVGAMLRHCTRILVHCERLRHYFEDYASVEYIDHYVRFAAALREQYRDDGYVLWMGVREPAVASEVDQ